jgi:hypothetical protein
MEAGMSSNDASTMEMTVTGNGSIVRYDDAILHSAVMSNISACHDQSWITDKRQFTSSFRSSLNLDSFANDAICANDEASIAAAILAILGWRAKPGIRIHGSALADSCEIAYSDISHERDIVTDVAVLSHFDQAAKYGAISNSWGRTYVICVSYIVGHDNHCRSLSLPCFCSPTSNRGPSKTVTPVPETYMEVVA